MKTATLLTLRDSLAAVLIVSSGAKLARIEDFAATLKALGLSANQIDLRGLAAGVAGSEGALGMLTVAGLWPSLANIGLVLITAAFALVSGWAAQNKRGAKCRCFGVLSDSHFGALATLKSGLLLGSALAVLVLSSLWQTAPDWSVWQAIPVAGYSLLGLGSLQAARTIGQIREGSLAA
jgi:uncharacterized membrane protein YphA (DoxX/SURF4 family)